ncbi:MAG: hypothetical protein M3342_10220 [Bacteroidota bacterium]|nr:hypothetical protein [Flavisolibacter sp.]MBD0374206.1 hypothetical protein [Flavisolibacter sp.]MDQ3844375.1 hypothetical protein [Bacteroidota bacterium]
MKKILRSVILLLTFELPLAYEQIEELFINVQQNGQQRYSNWSVQATFRKVIFQYWYHYVLLHFAMLFGLSCLVSISFNLFSGHPALPLLGYLVYALITFVILHLSQYKPFYHAEFLPKLETIAATFEGKQLAQLEKCKQAQYSNLTLVLLFYVWNKTGDLGALSSSDHLAKLLTKVYGVDNGSLKKNLELILNRHTPLSARKLKEVEKGFEEAYSFFESLHYGKGIQLLKALELKIKSR